SLLGGIAGLLVLFLTKDLLLRLAPDSLPRLNDISISWSVLVFALVVSIATGLIFGLAPAWHAGRFDLVSALKESSRGSTGSGAQMRTRSALVVTEFALSLVLMISAGLLLRSFWDLLNVRLGFNPQNVVASRTRLPAPNDRTVDLYPTPKQESPFLREVIRRNKALPGVEDVALGDTSSIPLDESMRDLKLISEGQFLFTIENSGFKNDQTSVAYRTSVTPNYFHLLEIPLQRGRLFNDQDDENAPQVAVVNDAFARAFWPNQDPLGKRFKRA